MTRKNLIYLSIFLIVSIFIVVLDQNHKIDFVTFGVRRIFSPLQQIGNVVGEIVGSPYRYIKFINSGEARIKNLEQRNLELVNRISEMNQLKNENLDLHKQLGSEVSKSHFLVPALVLGKSRLMEIKVESDKVSVGQSVVYLNFYIGKIIKMGNGIAYVQMVTDPDSKIPAKTQNATGLVVGQFSSDLVLDKVSKSEILNVGDEVLTLGTSGEIVPNLILGKVGKIISSSDELFQKSTVVPYINFVDLTRVFVIVD